jgi:hypothetical protein
MKDLGIAQLLWRCSGTQGGDTILLSNPRRHWSLLAHEYCVYGLVRRSSTEPFVRLGHLTSRIQLH